MTRNRAYVWLSHELNIECQMCHAALLTKDQLKTAIAASKKYYSERERIIERRIEKRREKHHEQFVREKQRIKRRKRTGA